MRRGCFIRVMLTVAALVMAAGIAAAYFLPRCIPRASGRETLDQWINQNTNAELAAGYVAPLLLPGVGVQIRDLELKIKGPGGESREFFSAKAIKFVTDTPELIENRRVTIKEIIVESPRIVLVREADGQWNAARWAKTVPAARKKPEDLVTKEEQGLFEWIIKDSLKKALPETGFGLPELFAAGRVQIKDARVVMYDRCTVKKKMLLAPVEMNDVQVLFTGAVGDNPASFTISFPFPQGNGVKPGPGLQFKGRAKAPSEREIVITSMSGGWSDIAIHRLSGKIHLKPFSFDAGLDATASFPAVKRAAMWAPIAHSKTMPDMEGQGFGRVKARVWGPDKSRAAKVHYTGRVDLDNMTWYPGRVISPLENVTTTIFLEDGAIRMPPTVVNIAGSKVTGSGRMIESKRPRFFINAETNFIDFHAFFHPRKTPYREGKPMLVMKTLWGGSARIGEGVYNKMRIKNVSGTWDVTNKRLLTLPELEFDSCGGHYSESGRSWIDFDHPTQYRFRFDGRIRGMDMTEFTDQVFDTTTFLHGRADADGYIAGMFRSGEFITRQMNGDLAITFSDGYFEGFNLIGSIMNFFKLGIPEDFKGQKFRRMSARARFENGVAFTDNLQVESAALKGDAKGWIDFATQHTDLKIKINFLRPVSTLMHGLPLVGVVTGPTGDVVTTLYVRVYGHWDRLKYAAWNPLDDSAPKPPGQDAPPEKESGP